jgi:hypothetical protein
VIDLATGVLRIPEDSTITEGEELNVSYTYAANRVLRIRGGVKPQQRFRIVGMLKNRPTNRRAYLEVYDVALGRAGDTDLLGAEALQIELTGTPVVPAGKTEPYFYEERIATS